MIATQSHAIAYALVSFYLILIGILPYEMGGLVALSLWGLPILLAKYWINLATTKIVILLFINTIIVLFVAGLIDGTSIDYKPIEFGVENSVSE
jgi:hypothetical protein